MKAVPKFQSSIGETPGREAKRSRLAAKYTRHLRQLVAVFWKAKLWRWGRWVGFLHLTLHSTFLSSHLYHVTPGLSACDYCRVISSYALLLRV
jgi:hypothetical protein